MESLKFYVYRQEAGSLMEELSLQEAIYWFRNISAEGQYKALGIQDQDGAIDLLIIKDDIITYSQDYLQVQRFKDNKLISVNVINILKDNFGF